MTVVGEVRLGVVRGFCQLRLDVVEVIRKSDNELWLLSWCCSTSTRKLLKAKTGSSLLWCYVELVNQLSTSLRYQSIIYKYFNKFSSSSWISNKLVADFSSFTSLANRSPRFLIRKLFLLFISFLFISPLPLQLFVSIIIRTGGRWRNEADSEEQTEQDAYKSQKNKIPRFV